MLSPLAKQLLAWYAKNARSLPWRGISDPYAIWVSEIMLQQTRVETVIPYYQRWMIQFPTVEALAAAEQQEVLNLWEGLGYYSRARNLHRAAQILVSDHNGILPADVKSLRELPGIGEYTAAAIASISFGLDEAALDGNIRRVLARIFDVDKPLGTAEAEKTFRQLAKENLPTGRASDYNQALMDLGANICVPRAPRCDQCPVIKYCQTYELGIQAQRPVKKKKAQIPHLTVTAAVIQRNEDILIAQRPEVGLLGGMWEFPGGKVKPNETLEDCLKREITEELGVEIEIGEPFGVYQHAYTHYKVTLHAFCSTLLSGEPQRLEHTDLRWVAPSEFKNFPMGKIDRQIADSLNH